MTSSSAPGRVPFRLGAYNLIERLGAGGMGEVWRAEHVRLGRSAAIKVIRRLEGAEQHGEAFEVSRKRFEREARVTASLTSPHTVALYDFGVTDDETFYYAMELLEGLDIEALVGRHGPQYPARVVHLLTQACDSIAEAHTRGLLHRDIKPSNLFVSRRGLQHDFLKVLDFGLVKPAPGEDHEGARLTAEHTRVGTPAFMAPESITGGVVDQRADVYALGCVAYFLITGTRVFPVEADSFDELMAHVDDEPEPPSSRTHLDVPRGLEEIVLACLAKRPDDRPDDAVTLKWALDACEVGAAWTLERAERWWRQREPEMLAADPASGLLPAVDGPIRTTVGSAPTMGAVPRATGPDTLVEACWPRPPDLPAEQTPFVGRVGELIAMDLAYEQGGRLLTLHGPGGVGKTRLALRGASQLASRFPAGVWLCDLSDARDVGGAYQALAEALGVLLTSTDSQRRLSRVLACLGRALLVLDNADPVLGPMAPLVARWLREAQDLSFLVTSREPLQIEDEQVLPVEPLEVPRSGRDVAPGRLAEVEAVALFVSRAAAADPSFALTEQNAAAVAELVTSLDGLPLAIELAAAQIGRLPVTGVTERVSQRLDRLRAAHADVPPRQATLEATLDWSWDLLSGWERAAVPQLATFRGGFTLEAADAVVDLSSWANAPTTREVIEALLDKSLLRRLPGACDSLDLRLGMFQSIRAWSITKWADEHREAGGRAAAEARHGRFFATLGESESLQRLRGPGGNQRMTELALERENLYQALRLAIERDDHLAAVGAGLALLELASERGPVAAGIEAVRPVLRAPELPTRERIRLLAGLGTVSRLAGQTTSAWQFFDEATALAEAAGERGLLSRALGFKSTLHVEAGDNAAGRAALEQARVHARASGDLYAEGQQTMRLAILDELVGEPERAIDRYSQAIEMARAAAARDVEGAALGNLAELYAERGELTRAEEHCEEALVAYREVGSLRGESHTLRVLGDIQLSLRRYERAEQFFGKALELARRVGVRGQEAAVLIALSEIYRRCRQHERALEAGEAAIARVRRAQLVRDEGPTCLELALTYVALGRLDDAQPLIERAVVLMADAPPSERSMLLSCQAELAAAKGDTEAAEEALAAARALAKAAGVGENSRLAQYLQDAARQIRVRRR